jgi:hypothetical protein
MGIKTAEFDADFNTVAKNNKNLHRLITTEKRPVAFTV